LTTVNKNKLKEKHKLIKYDFHGAIAQLVEHLRGTQKVGGSIPPGSTKRQELYVNMLGYFSDIVQN
jgi:hypothetical protein